MDTAFLGLQCPRCAAEYDDGPHWTGCIRCRDGDRVANLEAVYDFARVRFDWRDASVRGLWRYQRLLPLRDPACRVTLGEGGTPFIPLLDIRPVRQLYLKNETVNPTWSYKDRMCAVGASVAVEHRAQVVGISSTSNQGASGSAYAAAAGLHSVIVTLEEVDDPTLAFMQAYGALLIRTTRAGRRAFLRHGVEHLGWFPMSSFTEAPTSNPYAIEGYKTIAFEIFEQLGDAPEVVVVPTSIGEGLSGIFAGFRDLVRMELVDHLPRMVAVEPAAGGPLSKTLEVGADATLAVEPYRSLATTLATTVASDRALLSLRDSQGAAVRVTDDELVDAQRRLLSRGLLAEVAGAAGVAAIPHLGSALSGFDPERDRVAIVMTGSGQRELAGLRERALPLPVVLKPDINEFVALIRDWSVRRGTTDGPGPTIA